METEEKKDEFIRKLVKQQAPEKAPEGFTEKVMKKLPAAGEKAHEPIFSPVIWFVIFLGAAAIIATFLFLDIPLINDIFSSSGIKDFSLNFFSDRFFKSFLSIFQGINIDANIIIIIAAIISLVVIERIWASRRSSQGLMLM